MRGQGRGEEPSGRGDIPAGETKNVDDLAVLVYRPVHVPPHPIDLDVGLVDEPRVTHGVPIGAGRIIQPGGESLDPPAQGDVIDVDAALIDEAPDPVGQAVLEVPADRQQDHHRRKRNPANAEGAGTGRLERRLRFTPPPPPIAGDPSKQQNRSSRCRAGTSGGAPPLRWRGWIWAGWIWGDEHQRDGVGH